MRCNNICIIGVPEREERDKGFENVFNEIVAEKSPRLKMKTNIQVQETQRVLYKMNPNRATPRHIITARVRERI